MSLLASSPASGQDSAARTSASSQPGSVSVSLFSSTIYSASEAWIPAFTAALKPLFSVKGSTRTSGKLRFTNATEPSVEPLSTRIVSKSLKDCSRSELRHGKRNLSPFQLGTTTVTLGGKALSRLSLPFHFRPADPNLCRQVYHAPEGVLVLREGDLEGSCRFHLIKVGALVPRASGGGYAPRASGGGYAIEAMLQGNFKNKVDCHTLALLSLSKQGSLLGGAG